jgi:hypothetical protein
VSSVPTSPMRSSRDFHRALGHTPGPVSGRQREARERAMALAEMAAAGTDDDRRRELVQKAIQAWHEAHRLR